MATVTPNFNWPVPTSTDLVKDGATAIEALGDSIDASLIDLKGGTIGQVLSKTSNTDMDFTWVTDAAGDITGVTAGTGISGGGTSGTVTVTNSMATAIDAKGDLIPGTGADTFGRLVVGANETRLVADSTQTTGLKYVADTTNYAIAAKGNLLVGTAADTLAALTVGANGTTLVADSVEATGLKWVTPSAGGMTLLSTTTLTGASTSISVTPTGYNQILVYVYGVTNGSNGNVFLGLNSNTTAGDYVQSWQGTEGTGNYEGANVGIAGVNAIIPGTAGWKGSDANGFAQFIIYAPNTTHRKLINSSSAWFSASDLNCAQMTVCNFIQTAALSSVQVKTTVGSFTAGTALVYGVK
jgi:hypothetical protein